MLDGSAEWSCVRPVLGFSVADLHLAWKVLLLRSTVFRSLSREELLLFASRACLHLTNSPVFGYGNVAVVLFEEYVEST